MAPGSVSPCGPAGSLFSTAHDMARWLQLLLGNGRRPDGTQVLQESVLRETTRAVMPPPGIGPQLTRPEFPIADVEQSYGMGWITSNYRGYRKVWHSGGIVTYSSRLWLLPEAEAGLFLATSGPQTRAKGHALTAITSLAADLLLGEDFWLNSSTVCTFPAPWKATSTGSAGSASEIVEKETSGPEEEVPLVRGKKILKSSAKETGRAARTRKSLDELLGVYAHKAFGEMVVEKIAGSDVIVAGSDVESGSGNGNGSDWLLLRFGRFGKLRMRPAEAGQWSEWEGRFVGPLWYVTASDEYRDPVRVQFLQDEEGNVDGIRYPIDGQYDVIKFDKRGHDVGLSSSYSTSCQGCTFGSVLVTVAASYVLETCIVQGLSYVY